MSKKANISLLIKTSEVKNIDEKHLKSLNLNDRQVKAILFAKENGKITNSEYQTLTDCSRNTASNDLAKLVDKGLLKPSGQKGAGAFYTLK